MDFATALKQDAPLLADGATGTNFFAMGLGPGEAPELWNAENPEIVKTLHRSFVEAGADILLTNTFGGTRFRLKLHDAQARVFELNKLGAELAREVAAEADRPVWVAGSVGPTGELIVPLGELTFDAAVEGFSEQIAGLKAGGVDVIWIETMSAPEEIRAAATAAINAEMPYTACASFDTAGHTMMGLSPEHMGEVFEGLSQPPVAFGANCGVGAPDLLVAIAAMHKAAPDAAIIAKGNCGVPRFVEDQIHYSGSPELMAEYARLADDLGVAVVGGCCGTTAEHLAAMREAIDDHVRGAAPDVDTIVARLGPLVAPQAANRDPSAGRRRGRRRRD